MQSYFTFKKINLLASLLAFILIVAAIIIQIQYDLEPCPLCITQRIIFIITAFAFLFFAFFKPTKLAKLSHLIILSLVNVIGIIFALRHILIQGGWIKIPAECGVDLGYMFDNFPLTQAFNLLFQGAGDCSKIDWLLFGLTLPQLAFLWYFIFLVLTIYIYCRTQISE